MRARLRRSAQRRLLSLVVGLCLVPVMAPGLSADVNTATLNSRPTLCVTMVDRSSQGAAELGAARTRARFIFEQVGIRIDWSSGEPRCSKDAENERISVVVLGGPAADGVIPGNPQLLGFAIPSAQRVYVHYDRVHALAHQNDLRPGWLLGLVIAHELVHVLLPASGHSDAGVMASVLKPRARLPPPLVARDAEALRARVRGGTALAQLRIP